MAKVQVCVSIDESLLKWVEEGITDKTFATKLILAPGRAAFPTSIAEHDGCRPKGRRYTAFNRSP